MSDSRLLIDLGNSRIKWAWARGGNLEPNRAGQGDFVELERACRPGPGSRPVEVLLSSVAKPDKAQQVVELCTVRWDIAPRVLCSRPEQGGVRNGYREPEKLGVDRWLAIVGAAARHGKPVIVWDLGTAATLDAVDESGQHLGGWILPGPAIMLDALGRNTGLGIPQGLAEAGTIEPGRATAECIRRGVLAAQAGALEQFMGSLAGRVGANPKCVVTGGAGKEVLKWIDSDCVFDPLLVFRGMLVD